MKLVEGDRKHWAPLPQVTNWLIEKLPIDANVLEIGPGHTPFPRASIFVDFVERDNLPGPLHKIDIAKEVLPFPDKSFDFVYCRHVLEDMHNPFLICAEMQRVGKAGYIETPSPLAEIARGIDGNSPPWRGYHHHKFVVWVKDGELCFVSKFPILEYLDFKGEADVLHCLRQGPQMWNTHLYWQDSFLVRHLQCPQDFDIVTQLEEVVWSAALDASRANNLFWSRLTAG